MKVKQFINLLSCADTFFLYNVEEKTFIANKQEYSIDSIELIGEQYLNLEVLGIKWNDKPHTLILDVVE